LQKTDHAAQYNKITTAQKMLMFAIRTQSATQGFMFVFTASMIFNKNNVVCLLSLHEMYDNT